ncbi:MAG: cell division protein FtsX, partial [Parvularculaceae bacterium]
MTIQVKGVDAAEIAARLAEAEKILSTSPSVASFTIVDSKEAAKLLEPWLGKGNADTLNVPALIDLKLSAEGRSGVEALSKQLEAISPGVILDDHGGWNDRLADAARSGQALAFAVFALS